LGAQNRKRKVAREKEYERQAKLLQQFFSMTKSQCPETTAQLGEPSTVHLRMREAFQSVKQEKMQTLLIKKRILVATATVFQRK
jgi:hypothetical protein